MAGEETRTHKAVKQTGLTSFLASGSNAGTSASAFAKKKKAPKRLEGAWQHSRSKLVEIRSIVSELTKEHGKCDNGRWQVCPHKLVSILE